MKFVCFAETHIKSAGAGIAGFVTSHGFLDNTFLRGMRFSLLATYTKLFVLDLHGNVLRGDKSPDGSPDRNVFDIKQTGVAISIFARGSRYGGGPVQHADVWGDRDLVKFPFLGVKTVSSTAKRDLHPTAPLWLFVPRDTILLEEYERGMSLIEAMPLRSLAVVTGRDSFVIDHDEATLMSRMTEFAASRGTDAELDRRFSLNSSSWWSSSAARCEMPASSQLHGFVRFLTYRPFDVRLCFYHAAVFESLRRPVMQNVDRGRDNLLLITTRMTKGETFAHVFVSNGLAEAIVLSSKTSNSAYAFPMYVYDGNAAALLASDRKESFAPTFRNAVTKAIDLSPSAEELFYFIYSTLHSSAFRSRYAEFLKTDFPRVPLPGSLKLFRSLAHLGGQLIAMHLMESPTRDHFITTYTGPKNPEVGRVGWSDDTVWLDATATKKGQLATPGTIGFRGVPEVVWSFRIGGYQVCEKWLKARKGRTLSKDDIAHYQKIVVALAETIRLMKEIDEVIEQHGGWPGAFQSGQVHAPAPAPIPFRPRVVKPTPKERYVTCVPLVPLKAAAGAFSDPQHIEEGGWEWTAVDTQHRLRPGMFVAQVEGKSMEPMIPDGTYCLFLAPVEGSRQGKTVLVQLRETADPETGGRYTVKRYESEKVKHCDSWRHATITLKPVNPEFEPIVLTGAEEGQVHVVAEVVEVLGISHDVVEKCGGPALSASVLANRCERDA